MHWFSEVNELWPSQAMSLEVEEVLHSQFQDILRGPLEPLAIANLGTVAMYKTRYNCCFPFFMLHFVVLL